MICINGLIVCIYTFFYILVQILITPENFTKQQIFIVTLIVTALLILFLSWLTYYFQTQAETKNRETDESKLQNQLLMVLKNEIEDRLNHLLPKLVIKESTKQKSTKQILMHLKYVKRENFFGHDPLNQKTSSKNKDFCHIKCYWGVNENNNIYTPDTNILDFLTLGKCLLILGKSGSGKTVIILKLALDLINEHKPNDKKLIPIILGLTTWEPNQTIEEWLTKQLKFGYNLDESITLKWLKNENTDNKLLLLLDGLNELEDNLEKCIDAIKNFRKKYKKTHLIICCRARNYENSKNKLKVNTIYLNHLHKDEIKALFYSVGCEDFYFKQKDILRENLNLPLHFKIIEETFLNPDNKSIKLLDDYSLLEDFIIHKLNSQKNSSYTSIQTQTFLNWLAKKLTAQNKREFLIEKIQPSLLENIHQNWLYRISFGVSAGIIFGAISGMIFSLFGSSQESIVTSQVTTGFVSGLVSVLIYGDVDEIRLFEAFQISWGKLGEIWKNPIELLFNELITAAFVVSIYEYVKGYSPTPTATTPILIISMLTVPIIALVTGIKNHDIENRKIPNQGILYSAYDAIFINFITTVFFIFIYILIAFYVPGSNKFEPPKAIIFGLSFGLFFGFIFGGFALIQHFILRFILWCNGSIPWNYSQFLSNATKQGFMLQVGGRYRFIHDLVREHFANRNIERNSLSPTDINVSELPSVYLLEKDRLPNCAAIYFVSDIKGQVLYIGGTVNLIEHWINHHRFNQLKRLNRKNKISIYWMACSNEIRIISSLEAEFINKYKPPLN